MRATAILCLLAASAGLAFRYPEARLSPWIDEFNGFVQKRLQDPSPRALGLSRVVLPYSMGSHFEPSYSAVKDFKPENEGERRLIEEMEANKVQLGVYVFGEAVRRTSPAQFSHRALKGPGAITAGTPRPARFVAKTALPAELAGDPFPDWEAMYTIAQDAMAAFAKGDKVFESHRGSWNIDARPAIATSARCLHCHNANSQTRAFSQGDVLGGVIYVYRITPR